MFQRLENVWWRTTQRAAFAVFLLLSILLMGCAARLSPDYDKVTFASLSDLNVKTETLFASLSSGGSAQSFPNFQATYATLIGGFSAALVTTSNRQTPGLSAKLLASPQLKALCGEEPESCVNPTPDHLEKVITLLTQMRNTHQRGKLSGELVAGFNRAGGFKGQYEIEMGRVLFFEQALQRSET